MQSNKRIGRCFALALVLYWAVMMAIPHQYNTTYHEPSENSTTQTCTNVNPSKQFKLLFLTLGTCLFLHNVEKRNFNHVWMDSRLYLFFYCLLRTIWSNFREMTPK